MTHGLGDDVIELLLKDGRVASLQTREQWHENEGRNEALGG